MMSGRTWSGHAYGKTDYNYTMKRAEILQLIGENKTELRRLGVKSLAIFGSVARDEATPVSDVDILVDFEGPPTFDAYMEIRIFLEDLLGMQVDLVTRDALRPRIEPYIYEDLVYVT